MSLECVRSVLVVIPTLNELHTIERVVDELATDWPPGVEVRMVVADGGSTDGTADLVRQLAQQRTWLYLLHNPRRIQSAAVNLAVRTLGGQADVLIRCDAHADYPSGFIARLLASLDRTQADAVVVPMDSTGAGCFQKAVAWVSDTRVGSGGSAHRGGRQSGFVDHGHHAAMRMSSFVRAGGYDETFTHNEDAELDCRQRRLGGRIYLDADIRVGYHPRPTPAGLWRQYFAYGQGRSRTVRRHPGSMRLRQLALPVNALAILLGLVLAPVWWPAAAWAASYAAVLAFTSVAGLWRMRSLCGVWAGVAAGTMHLSWALGFLKGLATIRTRPWSAESACEPNDGQPEQLAG